MVVSGRVPDLDSSQLLPVVNKLDSSLDKVRAEHPGYEIAVTGLSVIAARNSANMSKYYRAILDLLIARGFAAPREPVRVSKAAKIGILLRYAII